MVFFFPVPVPPETPPTQHVASFPQETIDAISRNSRDLGRILKSKFEGALLKGDLHAYRALAVLNELMKLTEERLEDPHPPITRASAYQKIINIFSSLDPLQTASALAPYFPFGVLNTYKEMQKPNSEASRPTLEELLGGDAQSFILAIQQCLIGNVSIDELRRKVDHTHDAERFALLEEQLIQALSSGLEASKHIPEAIARTAGARLQSEEKFLQELKAGVSENLVSVLTQRFMDLEHVLLDLPPSSQKELTKLLSLAVLGANEDGLPLESEGMRRLAKALGIQKRFESYNIFLTSVAESFHSSRSENELAIKIVDAAEKYFGENLERFFEFSELVMSGYSYLKAVFHKNSLMNEKLHSEIYQRLSAKFIKLELQATATYLGKHDVRKGSESFLHDSHRAQMAGYVRQREESLRSAGSCGILIPGMDVAQLLNVTGAALDQFHPTHEIGKNRGQGYTATFYQGESRPQFRVHAPAAVIEREYTSGNYPALQRALKEAGVPTSWIVTFLRNHGTESLVEAEYFARELELKKQILEGFDLTMLTPQSIHKAQMLFAHIQRENGPFKHLAVGYGYIGHKPHIGSGWIHTLHERSSDSKLKKALEAAGDDKKFAEWLLKEIVQVAGTSNVIIPSGHRPDSTSLLFGEVRSSQSYLTLVLAPLLHQPNPKEGMKSLVTTIYHPNSSKLRSYCLNQLKQLFEKVRGREHWQGLIESNLKKINPFLIGAGQKPIAFLELVDIKPQGDQGVKIPTDTGVVIFDIPSPNTNPGLRGKTVPQPGRMAIRFPFSSANSSKERSGSFELSSSSFASHPLFASAVLASKF